MLFLVLLLALTASCAPSNQVARQPEKPSPPQDAYYLFMLGYNAEKEGKWEEALTHYNKALQLDPSSSSVKTQISHVLLRTGKIKEALSMAEDTVKADPDYVPALMLLGELYNSQKRSEDSIKIYERILVIEPDNQEAALFLGLLYASLDQHVKATEILERIEKSGLFFSTRWPSETYTLFTYPVLTACMFTGDMAGVAMARHCATTSILASSEYTRPVIRASITR